MWGAATDADVYVNIYGEIGDTGERRLRKANNLNKYEKGHVSFPSVGSRRAHFIVSFFTSLQRVHEKIHTSCLLHMRLESGEA